MPLSELDINKLSRLISPHVDQVTCIECCKYYLVPSTAICGHTLCHGCWIGRKNCAACGAAVIRKSLKLNLQLQKITEHTQALRDQFEKIFKVNLDEFLLDTPIEKESNKDPTKNVRDWLANSENQFSAPGASQQSTLVFNNQQIEIGSKVQIHSETSKTNSTRNIIHVGIPQDDWDKIEEMPDTEELHIKHKENAIGPIDIEPFVDDLSEFTMENPRRSSRKRDGKAILPNAVINSVDQNTTKDSNNADDSKVLKQNWTNIKRMKKQFSKLNKKSKNKLNVSIEMCKKTVIPSNKNKPITTISNSEKLVLNTDDNIANIDNPKECATFTTYMVEDKLLNNNELFKHTDEENIQNDICETVINKTTNHIANNANIQNNQLSNISNSIQPQLSNNQIPPVAFIMKGALQTPCIYENTNCCDNNKLQNIMVNTDNIEETKNNEDIEITIKIGNTITNICIKKKEKDVQLKINTDREIQTSLEKCLPNNRNNASCSPIRKVNSENNVIINVNKNIEEKTSEHLENCVINDKVLSTTKTSLSNKKNTDSADTATAQYEITESIEKELSKEMQNTVVKNTQINTKSNTNNLVSDNIVLDEDCLNDLDLFDNDSVKEGNIQSLKSSKHAASEILISTLKSTKTRKQVDKRVRNPISDDLPISKKMKIIHESNESGENIMTSKTMQSKNLEQDTETTNYDVIMGKVFANIDSDLAKNTGERVVKNSQFSEIKNDKILQDDHSAPLNSKATQNPYDSIHGQSENVFSIIEKENDVIYPIPSRITQTHETKLEALPNKAVDHLELEHNFGTPLEDRNDNSDNSIVEETPQKSDSFHKAKQKSTENLNAENTLKNKSLKLKRNELVVAQNKSSNVMSVINLSDVSDDTTRKSKYLTILEAAKPRATLETPLTIANFVEQIKHKSTPMAKKSLNFDNQNTEISDVDPEQTLCQSSFHAVKTTQEREFMCKAFEESPHYRTKSPLIMGHLKMKSIKYCLAGSCLTPSEISNVKLLCSMRKWDYVDKYTKDLTHLVVGVDDENKSQRSVKYMCALAASKWIVSYEWVQKCLQMKKVIDEEPYEALDNTGEPGPRRSRVATRKLFQGMTFFCMPPFSVLDVDTLKGMLEAAGGRVVNEAKAVRVTSDFVSLLLAEPEHTQENRFIYLAMELSIVPVNSEWVLNCLGSYTISSVQELLLCPESLLPSATVQWPPELMAKEYDKIQMDF